MLDWVTPGYVAIKVLAYVAWCAVGLRWLRPDLGARSLLRRAAGFGIGRFALGVGFGLGIWLASSFAFGTLHEMGLHGSLAEAGSYLLVYVPVRVLEWSIVSWTMLPRWRAAWIAGGIAVSCAADVPMMMSLGLPLGRFFC